MTLAQEFAKRLRQERRRKAFEDEVDISWEDVAGAIGLSGAAVSRYVKGRVLPDDDILQRLADYFGIRRVWLREGVGERYTAPKTPIIKETESERDITAAHQLPATSKRAAGARGPRSR